jgi:predicted P-loop ATPase
MQSARNNIGDKDSRLELCGTWILELAELDRVRRGELSRVKAFSVLKLMSSDRRMVGEPSVSRVLASLPRP